MSESDTAIVHCIEVKGTAVNARLPLTVVAFKRSWLMVDYETPKMDRNVSFV
jgi:hypothetical protein